MESVGDLSDLHASPPQPVGIYGWRKRCVYAFVLILMLVVVVNIALTVWLLRVLHLSFNFAGVEGPIFHSDGLKVESEAEFSKPVYTNQIQSTNEKPLYMMSNNDIQLVTTDADSSINSRLVIGSKSVEATCDTFTVQDSDGVVKIKMEGDKVTLGTKDATYPADIEFGSSVSTPTIRSPLTEPLSVEAMTSKVQVMGGEGVVLNSRGGDVSLQAIKGDVHISSIGGSVRIYSPDISMENLPKVSSLQNKDFLSRSSSSKQRGSSSSSSPTDLFQVCVCASGKLFTTPANEDCAVNPLVCNDQNGSKKKQKNNL